MTEISTATAAALCSQRPLTCLALQVGGSLFPAKNVTKKRPPILQTLLDVVRLVSQFFLGLLACIFRL